MYSETNTRILVPEFDYLQPTSLTEVLALLASHGEQARLIAGGTDLLVQMKLERVAPNSVISLAGIGELDGIAADGGLDIGAMTSIRSLANAPALGAAYAALRESCEAFSTVPIMIMGTIGGNLCNASPAADTAPALLAFDAGVTLQSAAGSRSLPLRDFFAGPGRTVLGRDEILRSIQVPEPAAGTGSAFLKISRVVADIAQVCAAAVLVRDGDEIADCRIALGSVAPTPLRLPRAEASLIGRAFAAEAVETAARIVAEDIRPITDVRATESYRRQVARVIVRDTLTTAWQRAGQGAGQ
jgi:carbon-monoxide dehydrogenase medium subunit